MGSGLLAFDTPGMPHLLGHLLEALQRLHVSADGEQDSPGLGESAQGLPLHAGDQASARILSGDGLSLPLAVQVDARVDLLNVCLNQRLELIRVVADLRHEERVRHLVCLNLEHGNYNRAGNPA